MFGWLNSVLKPGPMKKEIRIRCWIDIDGEKFFGPGRAELLELINETGSIAKAAKSMGMSYKKAWDMVNEMNTLGARPYVASHTGGDKGGGAQVTEAGKKMLTAYKDITRQLDQISLKSKDILKLV
jgi:molybdate transport system regulatory protein